MAGKSNTGKTSKLVPIVDRYERLDHPAIYVENEVFPKEPFACIWVNAYRNNRALAIAPGKEGDMWCVYTIEPEAGTKSSPYSIQRYPLKVITIDDVRPFGHDHDEKQVFKASFENQPSTYFELKAPSEESLFSFLRKEIEAKRLDADAFLDDFDSLFKDIALGRKPKLTHRILDKSRAIADKHPSLSRNHQLFDYLSCTTFTDVKKKSGSIRLFTVFLAIQQIKSNRTSKNCYGNMNLVKLNSQQN